MSWALGDNQKPKTLFETATEIRKEKKKKAKEKKKRDKRAAKAQAAKLEANEEFEKMLEKQRETAKPENAEEEDGGPPSLNRPGCLSGSSSSKLKLGKGASASGIVRPSFMPKD